MDKREVINVEIIEGQTGAETPRQEQRRRRLRPGEKGAGGDEEKLNTRRARRK